MTDIIIRDYCQEDMEAICRINREALGYDFPLEETKKRFARISQTTNDRIFVAALGEETIGYIHGSAYECTYQPSMKNIMALAVLNEYRGLKAGRLLLERLEAWAREDSCGGVRLVSGHNREKAHEFYQHCGYFMRKEQKNFMKLFNKSTPTGT